MGKKNRSNESNKSANMSEKETASPIFPLSKKQKTFQAECGGGSYLRDNINIKDTMVQESAVNPMLLPLPRSFSGTSKGELIEHASNQRLEFLNSQRTNRYNDRSVGSFMRSMRVESSISNIVSLLSVGKNLNPMSIGKHKIAVFF